MKQSRHLLVFAPLLAALLAVGGGGCASTPASASFASVTIHGHSAEEINHTTTQVFRDAGYSGGGEDGPKMVFQREGSLMSNLAYEGAVHTYYGAKMYVRVRTELVSLGEDSHRLQCQAHMVHGDGFLQDEQRMTYIRRGPYQKLLNDVAKQLK
jgi:hypothetical protein